MELPKKISEIESVDPNRMVIAGAHKVGKTAIVSELTKGGKWIILDLENGSKFLKNFRVAIKESSDLIEFGEAVVKAEYPYEGIIIDSLSVLEVMAKEVATADYRESLIGSTWAGDDIFSLPKGAGYGLLRKAFFNIITFIETLSPKTIYLGHLKASTIGEDEDSLTALEIDLSGKSGRILASKVDAVAFVSRNSNNETVLDFNTSAEMLAGTRADHLQGSKVTIAKKVDKVFHIKWDEVFTKKCY